MCGPTGIGFLWGKLALLEAMPPFHGGGEMIRDVYLESSTFAPPPNRFEAGTPAITQAIGLGAAVDYLSALGMDKVQAYEEQLGAYLYRRMAEVGGLRLYGPDPSKGHRARGGKSRPSLRTLMRPARHVRSRCAQSTPALAGPCSPVQGGRALLVACGRVLAVATLACPTLTTHLSHLHPHNPEPKQACARSAGGLHAPRGALERPRHLPRPGEVVSSAYATKTGW